MCGLAGGIDVTERQARNACKALTHRGPDAHGVVTRGPLTLAHTRLAIRDLDPRSDQPYSYGRTVVSYNGELWNEAEVREELDRTGYRLETTGDTEVVAAALDAWSTDALGLLDGMFALAWISGDGPLHVATDRYGEIPIHASYAGSRFTFASELKALEAMGTAPSSSSPLPPGVLVTVQADGRSLLSRWHQPRTEVIITEPDAAAARLRTLLDGAVERRTVADVPVACLLSGGLDSSAVLALLVKHMPDVVAYTAVFDTRSPDLRAARTIADHLGVKLVEVPVAAPSAEDLSRTVAAIEMPFKAQVEIGWACLALAEALAGDGIKAVYSGEGSDELWGSYGFSYHGITKDGWYGHRRKLFMDQYRKNFARVNKVFLARGVEPRMPFLDDQIVRYALSLPMDVVRQGGRPKAVLERSVADLLPEAILRRAKLAFQDGTGLKEACARAVANPGRYYRVEFQERFATA